LKKSTWRKSSEKVNPFFFSSTFAEILLVGKGNFGIVWLGKWRGGRCVVKKLKNDNPKSEAELLQEAERMKYKIVLKIFT
jgi:predicted Ser/Thr protein kinase